LAEPVYRRVLDLMEADLGDELVALDPHGGNCFGFNDVATWVWRRLERPASFGELRDELLGAFDVSEEQCTADLRELLDAMCAQKLLTSGERA
jgi:hypothetical protein